MNRITYMFLYLLIGTSCFLTSCLEDDCEQTITYLALVPDYISYEEFRASVKTSDPQPLRHPGKMYFKDDLIFISEINMGIHVIDNSNPSSPTPIAFYEIMGNHDLAVIGDYLHADSHVDLVTLDISDPRNAKEVKRVEEVFPYQRQVGQFTADPARGIVREWVETTVTENLNCGANFVQPQPWWRFQTFDLANGSVLATPEAANSGSGEIPTGVGGSLARFTIVKDHLYAVTENDMLVFTLANPACPENINRLNIGWQIETIFPFKTNLFIGSQWSMFIYNTDNPANPTQLSEFRHSRSCDPIAVENDIAYITLRNGTTCWNGENQLQVVDVKSLENPRLLRTMNLANPHGVGVRNNILFICEGEFGIKIFDVSKIGNKEGLSMPQIAKFEGIHAYDVIPLYELILVIGDDGLYQYDYSDLNNIKQVSKIPVVEDGA